MTKQARVMSAMAVIDLARELYERGTIDQADIESIDAGLFTQVQALIANQDMSQMIEQRYPESWIVSLWHRASEQACHLPIGVEIGAAITQKASGLINHFMQNCKNLQEVLDVYLNLSSLVNPADTWRMEKADGKVKLTFCFVSDLHYPQCAIERSMVFLYRWACHYTEQTLPLLLVEFRSQMPKYEQAIHDQFQCPIKYERPQNQLVFAEPILKTTIKHDQPYLKNILEQRVDEVLHFAEHEQTISQQIRGLLNENLSYYRSQAVVASELCMSRSTLSRKLKREGTSFTQLLTSVRRQLLVEYAHLPVKQLIGKLGFTDESAYYKAKKKWLD